jgi:hypothetical protein
LSGPASDIDYRTNPRALKWWRLKNHYSQRDVEQKNGRVLHHDLEAGEWTPDPR